LETKLAAVGKRTARDGLPIEIWPDCSNGTQTAFSRGRKPAVASQDQGNNFTAKGCSVGFITVAA